MKLVEALLDIIKGGEGSRGGKVIGHTKSGKPIYGSPSHSAYKGYTIIKEKTYGSRRVSGFARAGNKNARTVDRRVLLGKYVVKGIGFAGGDRPFKTLREAKAAIDKKVWPYQMSKKSELDDLCDLIKGGPGSGRKGDSRG